MKKTMSAIILVIAGLVITSSATAIVTTQPSSDDNLIAVQKCQPLATLKVSSEHTTFASAQITATDYNDNFPSVAASPTGIFYAMADTSDDGVIWQPTVYSSDSSGQVWQAEVTFLYPGVELTALDSNSVGTYGTFGAPPDAPSQAIFFQAEDAQNTGGVWDWSTAGDGFGDLYNVDIACYNDPNPNATQYGWNLALTGYYGAATGVPMVMYQEFGPHTYGIMSRSSSRTGYDHAANSVDQKKLLTYNVFDRTDGTDLFVRVVNVGVWTYNSADQYWGHSDKKSLVITEPGCQLRYPDIAASNDTVIVVAQKINGSVNDIVAYCSSNGMSTYTRRNVANSVSDETFPRIVLTGEKTAVCSYTKNGVLYYKETTDGGVTWGNETQVSDSQVNPGYHTNDLCSKLGSSYGVWEDTRDGNTNIYFDQITEGPAIPVITIGDITAGIGKVTAQIKNTGTGPATNVEWNITLTGGLILLGKNTVGTPITSIAATGSADAKSKFIFGLGKPTITVHAKCAEGSEATKTVSGSVFLFIVKIV